MLLAKYHSRLSLGTCDLQLADSIVLEVGKIFGELTGHLRFIVLTLIVVSIEVPGNDTEPADRISTVRQSAAPVEIDTCFL